MNTEPTEDDLRNPEFQAIWLAIKGWDISRENDGTYAGATGTDVMTIINAVRSIWTCRNCHHVKFQKDMRINCCPKHNKEVCEQCYAKLHPREGVIFPEWTTSTDIETAVFEALGAASVCWETPEGAGVFDSDRCKRIGEELVAYFRSKGPIY